MLTQQKPTTAISRTKKLYGHEFDFLNFFFMDNTSDTIMIVLK